MLELYQHSSSQQSWIYASVSKCYTVEQIGALPLTGMEGAPINASSANLSSKLSFLHSGDKHDHAEALFH